MRLYKTTCFDWRNPDQIRWVRYSANPHQGNAAKSPSWVQKPRRIVIEVVDVPDGGWEKIFDTLDPAGS